MSKVNKWYEEGQKSKAKVNMDIPIMDCKTTSGELDNEDIDELRANVALDNEEKLLILEAQMGAMKALIKELETLSDNIKKIAYGLRTIKLDNER